MEYYVYTTMHALFSQCTHCYVHVYRVKCISSMHVSASLCPDSTSASLEKLTDIDGGTPETSPQVESVSDPTKGTCTCTCRTHVHCTCIHILYVYMYMYIVYTCVCSCTCTCIYINLYKCNVYAHVHTHTPTHTRH